MESYCGIERVVFFNSNQYPNFLVDHTISLDSKEKLYKLTELSCPHLGSDLVERNSVVYVRCGLFWPTSKVTKIYIVNK
ncbi:hypothetical protein Ldro_0795 [Legionella drozanskii LLAP-1]|uniref:Uncharacterized protein n=1 Tax=Legionella drozanskii LLAP-1 TaxID=1212489 RepID=A0A0W0SYE3_9GAMM|nr:hypothetical protein Ldro_0795 [Legionella drozanskii LLAP-1]